ncbi:hypothetical protein K469DRAFT_717994 [Zopfia rhizophila CBS 207.26]|uniref:RBR-type E3 ubiquitin transferase n=1 Tax=Zopfia rhizophila CBS 207.26 TaxID=1314779 RepID=A0A6A6DKM0_9PEZI|nr:hypothetical protein K469DRAFT_717994 [Zopfia rhizophila CBS 207.26]
MARTAGRAGRFKGKDSEKSRNKCAVCAASKQSSEYPFSTDGAVSHVTCIECLQATLKNANEWKELGLLQPSPPVEDSEDEDEENEDNIESLTGPGISTSKPKRKRKADPWATRKKRKGSPKAPNPPPTHFTCRICVGEKPVSDFIQWIPNVDRHRGKQSEEVPATCMKHLARNPRNRSKDPVCKECIGRSMVATLDTLGAEHIGCLEPDCNEKWEQSYIIQHLPSESHDKYYQHLFDVFWNGAHKLSCPREGCGAVGLLGPQFTAGFPHVECYECKGRNCALCKVPWHEGLSCQQYRAEHHAELMDNDDMEILKEMAKAGGRRCPRCQMIVVKDGGCSSMFCDHCQKYFDWHHAEPVIAVNSESSTTISSSRFLREDEGIDHYREICELDALEAAKENPAINFHNRPAGLAPLQQGLYGLARPGQRFDIFEEEIQRTPNMPLLDEADMDL